MRNSESGDSRRCLKHLGLDKITRTKFPELSTMTSVTGQYEFVLQNSRFVSLPQAALYLPRPLTGIVLKDKYVTTVLIRHQSVSRLSLITNTSPTLQPPQATYLPPFFVGLVFRSLRFSCSWRALRMSSADLTSRRLPGPSRNLPTRFSLASATRRLRTS